MINPKAKFKLSKSSKIIIIICTLVVVLFFARWFVRSYWYIEVDCMPGIIGFERPGPLEKKCVSW